MQQHFAWRIRVAWWLIDRIVPWLRSSQEHYFERLEALIRPGMRILDIGCGKQFLMDWLRPDLYRRWTLSIVEQAVIFGVDPFLPSLLENPSRRNACALAGHLPFQDSAFDLVTANMVAEHLATPELALREIARVLQPGGGVLFHTPNLRAPVVRLSGWLPHAFKRIAVRFLEAGRQEGDVFPTLYRLNTKEAIEKAASQSGLEVGTLEFVFTSPLTQMLGPLVAVELWLIRLMRGKQFATWRPDLICLLRKPVRRRDL